MVYFAVPLADAKGHKKIYKTIKKARKAGALQRGVKEVNKALRKTPLKTPSSAAQIPGIAIIAGDISPDEVIMHLPIYCEEHNVPYLFVKSRLELGSAAKTKRPTSVVFIQEKGKESKAAKKTAAEDDDEDDGASYGDAYKELLKLAQKEYTKQMKDVLRG
ncbi:50S ribosomal protein L30e-like protein [Coniella lustricola]|uniref:50S ribosomal protein L30e-like protein n=1 Tax=Coniella lustricola TaxID=2025994 RepID=A0A2T3A6W5_9PEZI|nr:50S ribosomal protein L30e-like protein [Coniella lustricola]